MKEPSRHPIFHIDRELTLMGRLEDPTTFGKVTGSCGETMEFTLKIEDNRITDIRFLSDGCDASKACASVTAEVARGRSVDDAIYIEGDTIIMALPELPSDHAHCAYLAAETLHLAIHRWMLEAGGTLRNDKMN